MLIKFLHLSDETKIQSKSFINSKYVPPKVPSHRMDKKNHVGVDCPVKGQDIVYTSQYPFKHPG